VPCVKKHVATDNNTHAQDALDTDYSCKNIGLSAGSAGKNDFS